MTTTKTDKPGPKPDRVKIDEDWEDAVKKALEKKRPKGGWPGKAHQKPHADPDSDQSGGGSGS